MQGPGQIGQPYSHEERFICGYEFTHYLALFGCFLDLFCGWKVLEIIKDGSLVSIVVCGKRDRKIVWWYWDRY